MRQLITTVICACFATIPVFGRGRPGAARPSLSVAVFDYAGAARVLPAAFHETERILAPSGVDFTFVLCPDSPRAIATLPGCSRDPRAGIVMIDLLPRSASRRSTLPNAFGFADGGEDLGVPWFAGVFYDRVQDLSRTQPVRPCVILGAVLAHELGHLLLGVAAHTPFGIMTAHWTPKELLEVAQGRLVFSMSQGSRIKANVIARIQPKGKIYARAR